MCDYSGWESIVNFIVFFVCSWSILSHKVYDGVLVKAGTILVAFGSLTQAVFLLGEPKHTSIYSVLFETGIAVMCTGLFIRVEVYPRLSKYYPFFKKLVVPFCNICVKNPDPQGVPYIVDRRSPSTDL